MVSSSKAKLCGANVSFNHKMAILWLNETFAPHNFAFELDTITRTENDQWFGNWYSDVFQGTAVP